jgi:D-alanyl-D-alanine carboxypeptidase
MPAGPRIFLVGCLLLIHPAFACTAEDGGDARISPESLQAVVEDYLKDEPNILGTIVKVDIQGDESHEVAIGFIESSKKVPIAPDTPFIIGSVTKIFTAVLVHQLIEEDRARLDGPIIRYLPPDWAAVLEKIEHSGEITVEQLLSHRSGLADVTNSEAFRDACYLDPSQAWTPLDILRMVQQEGEAGFRPGEDFDYCNTNYILLGKLIEHVSGLSYRQSLQKNILDRIGLQDTFLVGESYGSFDGLLAHGYARTDDGLQDGHEVGVEWAHATGGLISTAGDLIAFYRALASGDLFQDAATYRRMLEMVGYNESYGRGLEVVDDPEIGRHYGHRGNFMGTRSLLAHFPGEGMTVAMGQTYLGFSMSHPADLMKRIVESLRGDAAAVPPDPELAVPEILADSSDQIVNKDTPAYGEWDFAPQEEWSLERPGQQSLSRRCDIRIDDDGTLYLLDRVSAKISVLDPDGNLLRSFGGHGDGPRFGYPLDLFITPRFIHVLDMARNGDKIKTYDRSGSHVETADVEQGVSPRLFLDDDRYVAVRSGPDVLNRPDQELLEILSRNGTPGPALAKFPTEEKLILETFVPMGRYILLQDNINIFPRLIVHFDGRSLYLGRSDAYTIKRIGLNGDEQLAFSLSGRVQEKLPPDYAVSLAARTKVAGSKEMPAETRQRFIAGFPGRQVFYTKIATDERGLVYVYGPDVTDMKTQEIDIFSPEGNYLYRAVIALPGGRERITPFELEGEHLYALVKGEEGRARLIKYRVRKPVHPGHP